MYAGILARVEAHTEVVQLLILIIMLIYLFTTHGDFALRLPSANSLFTLQGNVKITFRFQAQCVENSL